MPAGPTYSTILMIHNNNNNNNIISLLRLSHQCIIVYIHKSAKSIVTASNSDGALYGLNTAVECSVGYSSLIFMQNKPRHSAMFASGLNEAVCTPRVSPSWLEGPILAYSCFQLRPQHWSNTYYYMYVLLF